MKNCYQKNINAEVVENATISFSVSPKRTLMFSIKDNHKIFEVALAVVLYNDVFGSIMNM